MVYKRVHRGGFGVRTASNMHHEKSLSTLPLIHLNPARDFFSFNTASAQD